jgi:lipid-A-disaccharide synthase
MSEDPQAGTGTTARPLRVFVIAAEESSELLAASGLAAISRQLGGRALELTGVGGPRLEALGLRSIFLATDIQLMGVSAVLRHLPRLVRRLSQATDAVLASAPDLLLTVDVPDFSLRVARRVRAAAPGIPIVHWVAPTVWAWRPGRARAMAPHVDHVLALLPFEPEEFRRLEGPPAHYVGHPLLERQAALTPDADEQRQRSNATGPVILVLPGSRRSEIRHLLPVFHDTVRDLKARLPHARFVLPAVAHLAGEITEEVSRWSVRPEIVLGDAAKHAAFRRARVALAASGTVTLELALAGVPMVGAYRGGTLEAMLARRLVRLPSVLLCNLVLREPVVPQFLQEAATPAALAAAVAALVPDGAPRARQTEAFARLGELMALPGGEAPSEAAARVLRGVLRV